MTYQSIIQNETEYTKLINPNNDAEPEPAKETFLSFLRKREAKVKMNHTVLSHELSAIHSYLEYLELSNRFEGDNSNVHSERCYNWRG
jgi:hypothetical protein